MDIVLATRNKEKIGEMKRITKDMSISILTLDDFPGCPEVVEDGATFEENAMKKARAVAAFTGKAALADDSGLEVHALEGAPGILSARFAGKEADDRKNTERLLFEMRSVSMEQRGARFPFRVMQRVRLAQSQRGLAGLDTTRCFFLRDTRGHLLRWMRLKRTL
jgi:XTP/dITP diphosphohydrolase